MHCATLSLQHHYDAGKRNHMTVSPQSLYVIGLYHDISQTKNWCRYNIGCPLGLTFSLHEKLKNSIFEILIIPQTLNFNNYRTTRANCISLESLSNTRRVNGMFTSTVFKILLFDSRLVLVPAQWGTESKRVKYFYINAAYSDFINKSIFCTWFCHTD